MSRSLTKAANYALLLDEVRCDGDWDAVPEYVRKIKKHAPNRVCLTLTAETEYSIEKATQNTPTGRPGTAGAKNIDAAAQLPKLLSVIDEETENAQDRYQAKVCVGWLHWIIGEYETAYERLPQSIESELGSLAVSDWTRVCALKSAYLRANCLARNGNRKGALAVFQDGLSCITSAYNDLQAQKQLRYWTELFLTEYCMLFSHTLEQREVRLQDPNSLVSLRSWAKYWDGAKGAPLLGGHGFRGSVPRRRIWFEYYAVLSAIVEDDLPYPLELAPAAGTTDASPRGQLRMELKKVEAVYEALLLDETEFPRADEEREEVESFVHLVTRNWTIMKSRSWNEWDLGPGGKESLSRGVLDILYRTSTKTYHSTAILRYLFIVHLSIAEFDLGFKAFDSYLSLVKKAKARVVKTGHEEPSLDDDTTVLETVSQCILALCRYGERDAADKARGLGLELEQCLHELSHALPEQVDESHPGTHLVARTTGNTIPPRVLSAAWQAVGISQAQWARMTFDSAARPEIQAKAVRCLRKSLSPEFGKTVNLRSVFSLGLLLAEQRELSAAIDVVKGALLSNKVIDAGQEVPGGSYWRERVLVPLWHLLSLLLSARQDYVMAARACEGAFEQFKDPAVLFGGATLYRSEHLNEAEAHHLNEKGGGGGGGGDGGAALSGGLVDEMDDFEKEKILEVKMTQLALVELLESPRVAVNASSELVSLFTRLFGPVQPSQTALPAKLGDMPQSSASTLRSIKGGFFGRGGTAAGVGSERTGRPTTRGGPPGTTSSRPQTMQTVQTMGSPDAPRIQVTREGDEMHRSRRSSTFSDGRRSQSGKRHSLRKRDTSSSGGGGGSGRRRAASSSAVSHRHQQSNARTGSVASGLSDGEALFTPVDDGRDGSEVFQFSTGRRRLSSSGGPPVSMSRQVSQVESAAARARGGGGDGAAGSDGHAVELDLSSAVMPEVVFAKEHESRRRTMILVEVWLMIAGFYRRADMFDDAKGAVLEAQKLVKGLEEEVAKDAGCDVGSLRRQGWAGKKSIDELWADVWTETGHLSRLRDSSYAARLDFESALTHFPNHPGAIIGLSEILLDVYSEKLQPPPAIPQLQLADGSLFPVRPSQESVDGGHSSTLPFRPLGLATSASQTIKAASKSARDGADSSDGTDGQTKPKTDDELLPPYKTTSLPAMDRLAARDRAFFLLSGLTKLGSAWNNSEAWFTLARAHEESGQPDKAKEVLWWCVELEEAAAVRPWGSASTGGYVL